MTISNVLTVPNVNSGVSGIGLQAWGFFPAVAWGFESKSIHKMHFQVMWMKEMCKMTLTKNFCENLKKYIYILR